MTDEELGMLQDYLMVIFNIRNKEGEFDSAKSYFEVEEGEQNYREYPAALNAFSDSVHDTHYKERYEFENNEYEEELTFLINTAEQCKRPTDMLKFIGFYFKCSILQSDDVYRNKKK
jgi:hypothetical protein